MAEKDGIWKAMRDGVNKCLLSKPHLQEFNKSTDSTSSTDSVRSYDEISGGYYGEENKSNTVKKNNSKLVRQGALRLPSTEPMITDERRNAITI